MADRYGCLPERAILDAGLAGVPLRVLALAAMWAGRSGYCWAQQGRFADALGVHRTNVNKAIKLLEERGYLRRTGKTQNRAVEFRIIHVAEGSRDERQGELFSTPAGSSAQTTERLEVSRSHHTNCSADATGSCSAQTTHKTKREDNNKKHSLPSESREEKAAADAAHVDLSRTAAADAAQDGRFVPAGAGGAPRGELSGTHFDTRPAGEGRKPPEFARMVALAMQCGKNRELAETWLQAVLTVLSVDELMPHLEAAAADGLDRRALERVIAGKVRTKRMANGGLQTPPDQSSGSELCAEDMARWDMAAGRLADEEAAGRAATGAAVWFGALKLEKVNGTVIHARPPAGFAARQVDEHKTAITSAVRAVWPDHELIILPAGAR